MDFMSIKACVHSYSNRTIKEKISSNTICAFALSVAGLVDAGLLQRIDSGVSSGYKREREEEKGYC